MGIARKTLTSASLSLMLCYTTTQASAVEPVVWMRWTPQLAIGADIKVCTQFRQAVVAEFESNEDAVFPRSHTLSEYGLETVAYESRPEDFPHVWGQSWKIDLDADGEDEVLVQTSRPLAASTRYEVFLFDTEQEYLDLVHSLPQHKGIWENREKSSAHKVYEGWFPFVLVGHSGDFFQISMSYERSQYEGGFVTLGKLDSDAARTGGCGVLTLPKTVEFHDETPVQGIGPAFDRYFAILRKKAGEPASCMVSAQMRADRWFRTSFNSSLKNALYRPWKIDPRNTVSISFKSDDWQYQSIWTYKVERQLRELRAEAIRELAAWYREIHSYSAERAVELSRAVIGQAMPIQAEAVSAMPIVTDEVLWRSLMDGNLDDVLLAADTSLDVALKKFGVEPGELLYAALENTDYVAQLLHWGADPNGYGHAYGKTPLMYAAQFDLHDTAKALVAVGADLDLKTTQKSRGECNGFARHGRTALMYAAENASKRTVLLLIEAGADVKAEDSEGNTLAYYLRRNKKLTEQGLTRILTELRVN